MNHTLRDICSASLSKSFLMSIYWNKYAAIWRRPVSMPSCRPENSRPPRSTTNLAHDPDISGQLLCRPEILHIADRRQQDCRAFRTDYLEGLQIVEAIHFTAVGINCLV